MDRRVVLSGVAALAVPAMLSRAFAQTAAESVACEPPGTAETNYMKQTMALGSLSLVASRSARGKVSGPRLMEFVKFEIAEQETIGDILMGLMNPGTAPSGSVMAPTDTEAMAMVSPEGKRTLAMMQGMSGAGFQTDYVKAQISTHQKLLALQNHYLASGKNRSALDVAKLAKGMITEHLQLLDDIQNNLT